MVIDVNRELKMLENSLRDIIIFSLNIKYGNNWIDHLKITEERKNIWKEKMEAETKRLNGILIDNRLIYYSDFYDIETIIKNHWEDVFKEVFFDKKQIEVLLDIISTYRITIAHNRELLEHQKNLLVGASGMIRHMITEFKADRDNEKSYYPRFQNVIINDTDIADVRGSIKLYEKNYHVDDEIEVIVNVSTPPDVEVTYAIAMNNKEYFEFNDRDFSSSNRKKFKLTKKDIPRTEIHVAVKSNQDYHLCKNNIDLGLDHTINVLPNK